MSSFKDFLADVESSQNNALPLAPTSLKATEMALTSAIANVLSPLSIPNDKKQKFSESVSCMIRDRNFISEISEQIGTPSEGETEDTFVKNSSKALKKMLYSRFGVEE